MVPRAIAPDEFDQVLAGRHQSADLGVQDVATLLRQFEIADDLRESEHAHGDVGEADAVGELREIEGHAAGAGFEIGADHRQQQAEHDHGDRLEHRALRQHDRKDQTEHHEREVFGRPEQQCEAGQRRTERRHQHGRHATGEERADRRDRQRGARASLPRHLVAVERGDHGRRFARDVDQDRRGRSAVLRAVIDAGEHDQGAHGRQPEGDRQQHRDGRDGADARQHAHERADQCAEKTEQDVVGLGRDPKAQRQVREKVRHVSYPPRQNRGQSWKGRLSR